MAGVRLLFHGLMVGGESVMVLIGVDVGVFYVIGAVFVLGQMLR